MRRYRPRGVPLGGNAMGSTPGRFMGFSTGTPTTTVGYLEGDVVFDNATAHSYILRRIANLLLWIDGPNNIAESTVTGLVNDLASKQNFTVCTSSTRPGSPAIGDSIFETDTGNMLEWYGTTPAWQPPWTVAWGTLGYVQVTANQTTITTEVDLTSLTLTTTFTANRRIKITGACHLQSTVGTDEGALHITDATPTVIQVANTGDPGNVVGNPGHAYCSAKVTPAAGSKLYKLRALRANGTGTFTMVASATTPAFILIEDIGPNGVPS